MFESIWIKIGGIVVSCSIERPVDKEKLAEFYKKFQIDQETAQIELEIRYQDLPDLSSWEEIFDSGGIWRLWRRQDDFALSFETPVLQPERYQVVILNSDFTSGEVYLHPALRDGKTTPINPNLFEFLVVNYLSHHQGVMLHACAVKDGEKGRLFSGVSGAGKSTISNLWAEREGVLLLSDDRVILRKHNNRFWIYGTPWHGTAGFGSPESVPIDQLFVLRHAEDNVAKLIRPVDAISRLFVRCFPTFWDAGGMGSTLQLLAELSQSVPSYELNFRPEPQVIDFIRCLS
jgi:hypothetical protein